ncbi:PREDICTED: 3-hydroxyisobutyryl-CoA hydrolase, mitochondrial-like isoform X2 [Amphimedon queenslandica]|uniref:3-hydroxyisobutyryl-CoA hydrolase, mitochondrial n=1 Tax=Amphimedon queenslandica TaxID=400682 RepID=A0AAN0IYQ7_AMPQE|nr:PREDICTED: 3-hydroxyisobutyryl-CoA hydrolase, mitochondrial-like isoform X2 [Amphimedon queenslandica]|eukprot:XP_019849677.1 PREDICTED: 3-hydroxyisobutyryl-CoA hydrolase, mitochondrial-like isoform X2 [Amphimedon queenslandica]
MMRTVCSRVFGLLLNSRPLPLAKTLVPMSSLSSSSNEPEVLFETVKSPSGESGYRLMTLNKPKTLNALSGNMIDLLTTDMKSVVPDNSINFMLVRGGEKAFCAGGDIRRVTEAGKTGSPLAQTFFFREYQLNYLTGTVHKPYIALISGITMGGGVGISVHSPYRVATETTTFAMPETAIGFFPDVGGGYFLPRLKGELGMYLALTGHRLKGRDVLHGGIATHLIGKEKIPSLLSELTKSCDDPIMKKDPHYVVKSILDKYHKESLNIDDRSFSLTPHLELIDKCFSGGSVEDIQMSLLNDGSDWSINQLQLLSKMSPTSLKVTHRQLREGREKSFEDCLMTDYRLCQRFMEDKDFYEGVRAVLVDRDNNPKWDPPTLADVTKETLDRYFSPLSDQEELHVKHISKL